MDELFNCVSNYVETAEDFEILMRIKDEYVNASDDLMIKIILYLRRAVFQYENDYFLNDNFWHIVLGRIWNSWFATEYMKNYLEEDYYESDEVADVDFSMDELTDESWAEEIAPEEYAAYINILNEELRPFGRMFRRSIFVLPEEKPETFEQLLSQIERQVFIKEFDREIPYSFFKLKETCGFDHCVFYARPDSIDAEKLYRVIQEKENEKGIKIYTALAKSPEESVLLPWDDVAYSRIEIRLTPQIKFLFRKATVNSKTPDRKEDVYQLDVHVVPEDDVLGNINNYSVEKMQSVVFSALDQLYEECGIYIRRTSIKLFSVEINMTMAVDDKIPEVMWMLRWFKTFQTEEFEKSTYSITDESMVRYREKGRKLKCRHELDDTVTLETPRKDLKIIIYNKGRETIRSAEKLLKKNCDERCLTFTDEILRLEFMLKGTDTLNKYFLSDRLCNLSDNDLKCVWQSLVNDYLDCAYQRYADESRAHVREIVKSLKKDTWRDELRAYIMEQQVETGTTPYMIDFDSVNAALRENKIFGDANNRKYYRRELRKLFVEPMALKATERNNYKTLGYFIDKIMMTHENLTEVEIGYAVVKKQ